MIACWFIRRSDDRLVVLKCEVGGGFGFMMSRLGIFLQSTFLAFIVLTLSATAADPAATELSKYLDGLRGVQVDESKEGTKKLNERMDAAWKYIREHKRISLPVVEQEVKKALAQKDVDQFFIMDLSFLLLME